MTGFGLILGGGGTVGVSWTIGALAAASEALGFDFAEASMTVGTSAGSVVAPQILARRPLDEMVEAERAPSPMGDGPEWAGSFEPEIMVEIFQRWIATPQMDEETARWIGERALRASSKSGEDWVNVFARLASIPWPEADVRLIAVDCRTGRRTILSKASDVELPRAVAASSAVPGIIPPVAIADGVFMDGGVWSITNADLLVGSGVERAFILAPQAGGGFLAPAAAASLQREAALLEQAGMAVHTLVPGPDFEALGVNQMDPALRAPALEIGLREGAAWAESLASVLQ